MSTHHFASSSARLVVTLVLLVSWLAGGAARAAESAADTTASAARGRLLFEQALRADGSPLLAEREGLGTVRGETAACAACHRRSALGQREAALMVPPLIGPLLFAPMQQRSTMRTHPNVQRVELRAHDRPAYDATSLATALRHGVDPAGRPLAAAMPRYSLSDADVADIAAWLRELGQRRPPGLDDQRVHLASVFTPQADEAVRATVETAMRAWSAGTRLGRRSVAWQAWKLEGAPQTWPAQLEAHWRRQPVFALLSGAGGGEWQAVADFCESRGLPCLFPTLQQAPRDAARQHASLYLTTGVDAEVALLLRAWEAADSAAPPGALILSAEDDAVGRSAGAALQRALGRSGRPAQVQAADPQRLALLLAARSPGQDAVLWLRPQVLQDLLSRVEAPPQAARPADGPAGAPGRIWLSATLAPPHRTAIPPAWRPHVAWVSVHADRVRREAGAALSAVPWAEALKLPAGLDPVALADVHAATFFFSDALARMRDGLSGDYLIEKLESAVDLRPAGSGYFRLSLGPGQRIAAQGGQVLVFANAQADDPQGDGRFLRAPPLAAD